MSTLIKLRRDTSTNWTAANPVLALGEAGIVTDTLTWKVGDGVTAWNDLPYMTGGEGGGNVFSAITMTATPSGASDQINYGLGNLVAYLDGGWTIGEYDASTDTYGATGIRINPGIEGSADIVLPADPANVPVQINNYSGNVRIQTGEGFNWTFDSDGQINIPPESNSFNEGRIQSANGYPTLLAYGSSGEHGGPELDWMDSDDPANAFGNSSVLRNTMYINDNGLYVGINENGVANVAVASWRLAPDGNLVLPGGGVIQNPENSSLDPVLANVSTMVLTPDENYSSQALVLDPTSPGHIHLRAPASGNIDLPLANIFLGGEQSSFEVGASYGDVPNVFVHSGGNTWTFGTNGSLTVPGTIDAKTVGFPFTSAITNITTGNPTVIVDIADNLFGAPVTGQVTIVGVVGTTEANDFWYYQAVESNQFQLFVDAACTVAVDGTSWTPYVSGGNAYAPAYDTLALNTGGLQVIAGPSSWYFGVDGNISLPSNSASINYANGAPYGGGGGGNTGQWAFNNDTAYNSTNNGLYIQASQGTDDGGAYFPYENEGSTTRLYNLSGAGIELSAGANTWILNPDASVQFPQINVARGDTSSGSVYGYTLVIGDGENEAVITTPNGDPTGFNSSQRLVINPGKGADGTSGEGGDIYLWAGRGGDTGGSGGDIKIRGGQGMGEGGAGGYIRMEAGDGDNAGGGYPGYIEITGGQGGNSQPGGYVRIQGGTGQTVGGDANITGGYGSNGSGGNVNILGGSSGLGAGSYGNVNIYTGNTGNTWTFDQAGNLTVPANSFIQTAPGSGGDIHIHPDDGGRFVVRGATDTLVLITSDLPDVENRIELDTYGANLGSVGGGVFVGQYLRTNGATQLDDRLASFAGKGTENGSTVSGNVAAKITIDAANNWGIGNTPTHISFWTTPNGTDVPVEQVRIGPVGNLMVYNGNIVASAGRVISPLATTVSRLVSALPAAANTDPGTRAFVSDADTRTFGNLVVGGAGNAMPVWSDGVNWYIG